MIDIHNLPSPDEFRHHLPVQLRFNDVDVLGHVNNTVYFSFYDTGKAHYFQAVHNTPMDWNNVDTVIANVNCAYINPIFFTDKIEVFTRCESIHEKSFRLLQMIVDINTGQIKSVCESVMVSYDPHRKKSFELPEFWREHLSRYEGRDLTESNITPKQ